MTTLNHDVLIFILDDNIEVQKLVLKNLKNKNYKNVMAFSSFVELNNALKLNPDIIILDNYLSKDQDDASESIANFIAMKGQLPETEFIILSGETDPEVIRKYIDEGAYGYIIKDPGSMDKLISSIQKISIIK
jgi:DNA-binding NarL/FixJ family response regulator